MKCHKCANLIKDYSATETDKTFLYKCLKKNKWSVSTKVLQNEFRKDLRYGITSKNQQKFKKELL